VYRVEQQAIYFSLTRPVLRLHETITQLVETGVQ
jgi:hypothetical protein